MAEIIVAAAVEALSSAIAGELAKAASTYLAKQDPSLVNGVCDEMDRMKSDLESIQSLLSFADQKMEMNDDPLVGDWVKKVRDVAYKVEDVLETHLYGLAERERFFRRYRRKRRILATYRETAVDLERIRPLVEGIMATYKDVIRDRLTKMLQLEGPVSLITRRGEEGSSSSGQHHFSSTESRFNETTIVYSYDEGGVPQKETLERWVLEQPLEYASVPTSNLDPRWMCVAVCGMGGLGKTTLLRHIYHHNAELIKKFDCCAWVTVSQSYGMVELLRKISKDLEYPKGVNTHNMNEEELVHRIRQALHQKRYLIVFDDVWQDDFYSKIGNIFHKDDDRRSRILFTTRDERVALSVARRDRVMLLETLQEEEAWSLFCKKAFWQDPASDCPPDLECWARRIVGKCGGLPLAIVVTAGMMSQRVRDASVWERSYRMLISSELRSKPQLSVLMHSYYDLPSYLKRCFLYFSVFPEDWEFWKGDLIMYWLAEEFVEGRDGLTLEEVAEEYLQELTNRSMIQKVEKYPCLELYKMHDILRNIALEVSRGQKFGTILDEHLQDLPADVRRVSICKMVDKNIPAGINVPKLRTLRVFKCLDTIVQFSLADFKLLKVLDLEDAPISNIPEEIFDFFNLRYLNFRGSSIKADIFPSKIERLQNLVVLNLWNTGVKQLPQNVTKLQKLRRLYFGESNRGFQAPKGLWALRNLERLESVEANVKLVEQLRQWSHLRGLGITNVKQSNEKSLCNSLEGMSSLEHLAVHVANGDLIDLEYLNSPPPRLQTIRFYGRVKSIPTWFLSLNNLARLILVGTKLQEGDKLRNLSSLPCLAHLMMNDAYEVPKLSFPPNCFPSLKILFIRRLGRLTSIEIDEAALPILLELWILNCPSLRCPAPRVGNLQSLKELILGNLDAQVVQDFQEICNHYNNVKLTMLDTE